MLQRLIEGCASGQEGPIGHELAGPAEGQGGAEPVATAVEGHQLALVHRPVDDDHLVVGRRAPDDLDLGGVLVRPEEQHRFVRRAASRPCRRLRVAATPLSAALVQCSTRSD